MTNDNMDNQELIQQIEEYQEIDIEMKVGYCPECNCTFFTSINLTIEEKVLCPSCRKMVKLTKRDILTLQEFKSLLQDSNQKK